MTLLKIAHGTLPPRGDAWWVRVRFRARFRFRFRFRLRVRVRVRVRVRARERMGSKQPSLLGRRLSWHTSRVWHASLPAGKGDKGEGIRAHAKKCQKKRATFALGGAVVPLPPTVDVGVAVVVDCWEGVKLQERGGGINECQTLTLGSSPLSTEPTPATPKGVVVLACRV